MQTTDRSTDLGDLFGLPLKGKPTCHLEELSRHTEDSGTIVVMYLGTDGCKYRCTTISGQETWEGWRRGVQP